MGRITITITSELRHIEIDSPRDWPKTILQPGEHGTFWLTPTGTRQARWGFLYQSGEVQAQGSEF